MKTNNIGLEIINNFKNKVDLNSFESFCRSTYYLTDAYIIDFYKEYSNVEIEDIINCVADSIKLYNDEDYFSLFIHLKCNKNLSSSNFLSDSELEALLKYLEEVDEIPKYIKNILLFNKRKKYKDLIGILLKKKTSKEKIKFSYEYNNLSSLLASLFINPKKIFCGYDIERIYNVISNRNILFDFLQNRFGQTIALEIIEALKARNYNLLSSLIFNYKLDDTANEIKEILSLDNSNYAPINLNDLGLDIISDYFNLNPINRKTLREALMLTADTFKNNVNLNSFNKMLHQLSKDDLEEYLLKLRDIFKGLCINFDLNKKDVFQRELVIAKGLYYILALQKEFNIKKIDNVNVLFSFLESFYKKQEYNKIIDLEDIYQVINILSATSEPCIYDKKAFTAEMKKIGGFISPFKVVEEKCNLPEDKKEQELINHFNLMLKNKDNKNLEIEASFELALLRQKRLLDLLYYDNIPSYYDVVTNYITKFIKESSSDNSFLNAKDKDLINASKRMTQENKKEIIKDYTEQINLLKQAYERIEELEIENKMEFLEKKQNLCKEIYALQRKELNQIIEKSENKVYQRPIEVDLGKQNKVFDNHIIHNELKLSKNK